MQGELCGMKNENDKSRREKAALEKELKQARGDFQMVMEKSDRQKAALMKEI